MELASEFEKFKRVASYLCWVTPVHQRVTHDREHSVHGSHVDILRAICIVVFQAVFSFLVTTTLQQSRC